ncbi:hypothetical protein LEP1GSC050_0051 [Leptospira phage vB_LbrZ_5399-LE1]|uniref:Histidine kinase N-terminal 7TM region domain-containing protein n=1 Tax=Leptospira inadai serovar Lyme TaxID=293084 RepID=A0ABX4YGD8_9LEPT|nr:hypothetical protein [Leptospira inadai]AGS80706.1 hypothetical protein LEP1GSC050_0051 [Leptospira phage vB_LbrZ_5399-LE1]AGS80785.1 hypothetical protein LEP1GSC047_0918 [Leptospira phage vB_LinZ_10-LE1]PNV74315.1 hypothetical protein BES34_014105 [Leptospira inadai serovar Lyme]
MTLDQCFPCFSMYSTFLFVNFIGAFILLYLGLYVLRQAGERQVEKLFPFLSIVLSIAFLIYSVRDFPPRWTLTYTLNWIMVPIGYAPLLVLLITNSIEKTEFKFSKGILLFFLLYFLFITYEGVTLNFVRIYDFTEAKYILLWPFHVLIGVLALVGVYSIYVFGKKAKRTRGLRRVQFFLFLIGLVPVVFCSILFLYLLPLYGIFKEGFIVTAFIPFVILWVISILSLDYYKLKSYPGNLESPPFILDKGGIFLFWVYKQVDPVSYILFTNRRLGGFYKALEDYKKELKNLKYPKWKIEKILKERFDPYFNFRRAL